MYFIVVIVCGDEMLGEGYPLSWKETPPPIGNYFQPRNVSDFTKQLIAQVLLDYSLNAYIWLEIIFALSIVTSQSGTCSSNSLIRHGFLYLYPIQICAAFVTDVRYLSWTIPLLMTNISIEYRGKEPCQIKQSLERVLDSG